MDRLRGRVDRQRIDENPQRIPRPQRVDYVFIDVKHRELSDTVVGLLETGQQVGFFQRNPASVGFQRIDGSFGEYFDVGRIAAQMSSVENGEFDDLHHVLVDLDVEPELVADQHRVGREPRLDGRRFRLCGQRTCDQQQSYGEYFFNVKHTVCQLGAGYRRLKSFINDVT